LRLVAPAFALATLASLAVAGPRPAHAGVDTVTTLATLSEIKVVRLDSQGNLLALTRGAASALRRFPGGNPPAVLVASGFSDGVSMVVDSHDNAFVVEYGTSTVEKVTPAGARSLFASGFDRAACIAIDGADNLYVGEIYSHDVWKVTPAGVKTLYGNMNLERFGTIVTDAGISRLAGMGFNPSGQLYGGTYGNAGGAGPFALSYIPAGGGTGIRLTALVDPVLDFALGPFDNFYTAGYQGSRIGVLTMAGGYTAWAGTGADGYLDGYRLTARFNWPSGICLDNVSGKLYIADYLNNRIRVINSDAGPLGPTPTSNTSWGRVKSLYRR